MDWGADTVGSAVGGELGVGVGCAMGAGEGTADNGLTIAPWGGSAEDNSPSKETSSHNRGWVVFLS